MSSKPNLKAFEKLSFYEVLGVPQDVGEEELKRAYRQKVLEHHPDKNLDDVEEARVRFLLVKKAFETLSDEASRADYDFERANPRPPQSGSSTGFHYDFHRHHTQSQSYTQQAHNANYTSPSDDYDYYHNLHPLLKPFALLLGFLIFVIVGSAGYILSIVFGPRLPAQISHFDPLTFCRRYPAAQMENSTTIAQIVAFMEAVSGIQLTMESGNKNWFTVFGNFFVCIQFEEALHGIHANAEEPPPFGDMSTPRNAVEAFYKYWTNFTTFKDFSWMYFHQVPPEYLVTPFGREQAENQNRFGRHVYRVQYEGLIRALATKLREADPRLRFRGNFPQSKPAQTKAAKGPRKNNKKSKKRRR